MIKLSVIFLIFSLILTTALVKNSTKRIDDEIFTTKEHIRSLKQDFESMKLENNYLSSAEKLNEFQNLFFDEELVKKDIFQINMIKLTNNQVIINQFKLIND